MTFATLEEVTSTNFNSAATTHNVNMPATVNAGDGLMCLFGAQGTGTVVTTPSGWSLVHHDQQIQGDWNLYTKDTVAGDEDGTTVNFATDASVKAVAQVFRFRTGTFAFPPEINGTLLFVAQPDSPSLAPSWGSDDTLWIAGYFAGGVSAHTSVPSGYGTVNDTANSGASSVMLRTATRTNAASSEDPGAWVTQFNVSGLQFTIGIQPFSIVLETVAGSQPSATGTVHSKQFAALAGNQPAASGALTVDRTLQHKSLAGNQAAASGSVASVRTSYKTVAGAQPAASGAIAAQLLLLRAVAGDQGAPSGTVASVRTSYKTVAGNQPAATGTIEGELAVTLVDVAGAQPAATGAVVPLQSLLRSVAGAQPAASGAVTVEWLFRQISVAGSQPAGSGTVAVEWLLRHITLAGAQPAATGDLGILQQAFVSVAGVQPAAAGAVAFDLVLRHIAVSGNQAAAAGAIAAHVVFQSLTLEGNQPYATGALILLVYVLLEGNQGEPSGALVIIAPTYGVGFAPYGGTATAERGLGPGRASSLNLGRGRGQIDGGGLGPGRGRLAP
ncbi:MAG: hypothetical protein AB7I04_18430 [Pseudomonadales bacterium]